MAARIGHNKYPNVRNFFRILSAILIHPRSICSQIAVHNLGQGKLTLMDHDEEYICTFPSAYGRSILTVPWVELGGKVSITCPQTNYHANIEFKCKQFFSSDVNKVRWDPTS